MTDSETHAVDVRRLDAAVGFHFPGNPWSRRAMALMADRARDAESAGSLAEALACWRGVRSAAASVRSFYSPFGGIEAEASAAIERLEAVEMKTARPQIPNAIPRGIPPDPSTWAVLGLGLALAGFLGFSWVWLRDGVARAAWAAAASYVLFWTFLAVA